MQLQQLPFAAANCALNNHSIQQSSSNSCHCSCQLWTEATTAFNKAAKTVAAANCALNNHTIKQSS
jgi:hypothetical protein